MSNKIDRIVSHMAQSTVPTSGMLIGLSGSCDAVPVRSTINSSPCTFSVTTSGSLLRDGSGSSKNPSK